MKTDINRLFVYGTLLRGESRGKFLDNCNLLATLEVPGDLYFTDMGYPVASFREKSNSSVIGELYEIPGDDLHENLLMLDKLEGSDTGLFIRKELNHNGQPFYAYEAGKSLRNFLSNKYRIKSGNWRPHGSIAKKNPIRFAIDFEMNLSRNYRTFPTEDSMECIHIRGDLPLLLSAPHATAHIRMNKLKDEEVYTGALSVVLHSLTGSHVLYSQRASKIDPNFYDHSSFKEDLRNIVKRYEIKLVLDIHGTTTRRADDIYPGVGIEREFLVGNNIYLDKLFQAAKDKDISIGGFDVFPATRQMTVTKFVARQLGIPAIQIEVNERLRTPDDSPDDFERLVEFLSKFMESVND